MFKKKDQVRTIDEIPARFVKKGGVSTSIGQLNQGIVYANHESYSQEPAKHVYNNKIPPKDLSESYLSKRYNQHPASAPNSTKGMRKIFAPSFLLRRKKHAAENKSDYVNVADLEEEDFTDIACYEDLVAEQQSIDPVMLAQLDDSQINSIELERYERFYKNRLDFVLNNYRHPPPYPGHRKQIDIESKATTSNNTSIMQQLLIDKESNDNASMNNFWQASPKHKTNPQQTLQRENEQKKISDKLVSRTQNIVNKKALKETKLDANILYEKRKQYYMESFLQSKSNDAKAHQLNMPMQRDTISEIVYPEKDYDLDVTKPKGMTMSASVPNLSQHSNSEEPLTKKFPTRQPRAHMEPGEMEALIAHYRKTSLDTFEPYHRGGNNSESISLYSQDSPSYVPPSPYLSAEIPVWLQLYARASPDLDKYLKWEMFRHPELDCWQTMLKRLYKKELEQVVLWFEEYRLRLQAEIEGRDLLDYQLRKTEV